MQRKKPNMKKRKEENKGFEISKDFIDLLPEEKPNWKIAFKGYYEPTPQLFRKIGDGLMGVSSAVTGYAIVEESKILALSFLALGVLGKFLSNFFCEVK